MSSVPFLFFHLMANQELNPGAVEIHVGEGDLNVFSLSFHDEGFPAFAAALPCLIGTKLAQRLPPDVLGAMQDAGCQLMQDSITHCSSEQTKPVMPSAVEWLIGDWYLAPPARTSGNQAASRALSLKLLERVAADADTFEIEAIFRQDPVLAYHLLRLVNSLGVGVGKHISNFSQAILILGRQQLKRWLNLMLFAASRDDYRSSMLLARVAVRARSMELLAKAGGLDRSLQEHAFMTGMFSLLGILFGMPLEDVLKPLKLNNSLTGAILHREGVLGGLLHAVESAECDDDAALSERLGNLNLPAVQFNRLSLEAHQWMLGVIQDKQDAVNA